MSDQHLTDVSPAVRKYLELAATYRESEVDSDAEAEAHDAAWDAWLAMTDAERAQVEALTPWLPVPRPRNRETPPPEQSPSQQILVLLANIAQAKGLSDAQIGAVLRDVVAHVPETAADIARAVPRGSRSNYLTPAQFYTLNQACMLVARAFDGAGLYLVGSALRKRDYRDIDVRAIMLDDDFERLFPKAARIPHLDPLWMLICMSVSLWLTQIVGHQVDFQVQQMTAANETEKGRRLALGLFYGNRREPQTPGADAKRVS